MLFIMAKLQAICFDFILVKLLVREARVSVLTSAYEHTEFTSRHD
jgi:hypothetical protein